MSMSENNGMRRFIRLLPYLHLPPQWAPCSLTDLVVLGTRRISSLPPGTAGAVPLVIVSGYQLPLAPDPEELPPPNPPELDEEL
jgi:hypothetical protein